MRKSPYLTRQRTAAEGVLLDRDGNVRQQIDQENPPPDLNFDRSNLLIDDRVPPLYQAEGSNNPFTPIHDHWENDFNDDNANLGQTMSTEQVRQALLQVNMNGGAGGKTGGNNGDGGTAAGEAGNRSGGGDTIVDGDNHASGNSNGNEGLLGVDLDGDLRRESDPGTPRASTPADTNYNEREADLFVGHRPVMAQQSRDIRNNNPRVGNVVGVSWQAQRAEMHVLATQNVRDFGGANDMLGHNMGRSRQARAGVVQQPIAQQHVVRQAGAQRIIQQQPRSQTYIQQPQLGVQTQNSQAIYESNMPPVNPVHTNPVNLQGQQYAPYFWGQPSQFPASSSRFQ